MSDKNLSVTEERYRLPMRLANSAARLAQRLHLPVGSLAPRTILDTARRSTGLTDWGSSAFIPFMEKVLEIAADADLTPLAQVMIRQSAIQAVSNRLRIVDYEKRNPLSTARPLERPIFVLGFPRTGTTLLQNLLSLEDDRRALQFWELFAPIPVHPDTDKDYRRRVRAAERVIRASYVAAPEQREIHAITATSLEECWPLLANSLMMLNFDFQTGLRQYGDWLLAQDLVEPYAFYKKQLQLLRHQRPARHVVLKCPEHLWSLDAILRVFPDACIVWTHRDPADSVASYCSMMSLARRMMWGHVDRAQLGADISDRFLQGVERAMAVRDRVGSDRFFDVRFSELVADPAAMVRRINGYFDLEPARDADARVAAYLAKKRSDAPGKHRYSAAHYGLDRAEVQRRFGQYIERFEVRLKAA